MNAPYAQTLDKLKPFKKWLEQNNKVSLFHEWLATQPLQTKRVYLESEEEAGDHWWMNGLRYKFLYSQGVLA